MKKKCLIFCAIFFLAIAAGFSQDTSKLVTGKHLEKSSDTLRYGVDPHKSRANPREASDKAHSIINPNTGTATPGTTSGTLNSTVNPNTQFVIPIHKNKKRKVNSNNTPDSGIIAPK